MGLPAAGAPAFLHRAGSPAGSLRSGQAGAVLIPLRAAGLMKRTCSGCFLAAGGRRTGQGLIFSAVLAEGREWPRPSWRLVLSRPIKAAMSRCRSAAGR
ncbi:hypothetical protein D3C71_1881120 [compost metagenome]